MSKNTGGPAFPGLHPSKECTYKDSGMTLRDYFAAKAMQGIITAGKYGGVIGVNGYEFSLAKMAYITADAMLAEREK